MAPPQAGEDRIRAALEGKMHVRLQALDFGVSPYQLLVEEHRVRARVAKPRDARQGIELPQERCEGHSARLGIEAAARRVASVRIHRLAQQGELAHAACLEAPRLGKDLGRGPADLATS